MRLLPTEPKATKRAVRIAWTVVIILGLVLALWLVVTVVRQSDEIRDTQSVNRAQDSALAEANRRLTRAGEQPVPTPSAGPAGEPGQVGPQGPEGPPGPQGPAGPAGVTGHRGETGTPGTTGVPGPRGATGATGATGAQGPKGDTGAAGPAGPAGADGSDGRDGTDGKDGADAFPFTFSFTVQNNPVQSTTYTVTCTADGCTVSESDSAQG